VGGLAHYIEREGVSTTGISLIREHTAQIKPPRALWVPFPLGRPFGAPHDRDFQIDVLRSVLRLLERPSGPVLEDYAHDAPGQARGEGEAWSCLLPLPPIPEGGTKADQLREALLLEISLLRPWFEEGLRRQGRTAFGLSGLMPESMELIAAFLAGFAGGEDPALPEGVSDPMPAALRFIADDAKTFYLEAAVAEPAASTPTPDELNRWLYRETRLGEVLYEIRDRLAASQDQRLRFVPLIPAAYRNRQP